MVPVRDSALAITVCRHLAGVRDQKDMNVMAPSEGHQSGQHPVDELFLPFIASRAGQL